MTDKRRTKPPHEPTRASREAVKMHALVGTRQEVIADILSIDPKTLRKYYRAELDQSLAQANATIGGALFNKAKGGDSAAMIFWLKTRAGFRETQNIDHTTGGEKITQSLDTSKLSTAALQELMNARNSSDPE